ncbi:hypothetical protein FQN54_004624 [Arachnomyces sp. PD_36]|nr:hypothetical protein FQN54_004624 [Arachnomyces sp. PD_36]
MLILQYTTTSLLLHHSRTMPPIHSTRYLPSTTVLLSELLKLTFSLTISLYRLSSTIPPSMPATSLFSTLSSSVFSGDSWKLAIPAGLYTLANTLQYVAAGNLEPGSWVVSAQVKVVVVGVAGAWMIGGGGGSRLRALGARNWLAMLMLLVGVGIVQMAIADPRDPMDDEYMRLYIPQTVTEWREMGGAVANNLRKRSATYQGIEDDLLMMGTPRLDPMVGFGATVGSCLAAGLASVYLEKVVRESSHAGTSLWVRNVQLAVYSIVPALFIGVVFLDGEKIARVGFFEGYNAVVWAVVVTQAAAGIASAFCMRYADQRVKNMAGGLSIVTSAVGGWFCFGGGISGNFILGSLTVLASLYLYTTSHPTSSQNIFSPPPPPFITRPHRSRSILQNNPNRPPPIPIHLNNNNLNKSNSSPPPNSDDRAEGFGEDYPEPKDFSIKLPTTPLISEATGASRPGSPVVRYSHSRVGSRGEKGGYFGR